LEKRAGAPTPVQDRGNNQAREVPAVQALDMG